MDKLLTTISKLLGISVRLVEHTALTQNEVGKENVVLWNKEASLLDSTTYTEFKDALRKRQYKHYMHSHILSYPDFCIAILCSLDYSLNHNVTVGIPDRTYTAAWRAMEVISGTSTNRVSLWIKEHIGDRTAVGYCNALGVILDSTSIAISVAENIGIQNNLEDSELISSINTSDKVVRISRYDENDQDSKDTKDKGMDKIFSNTSTSEGPLYDLHVVHASYNNTFL